MQPTPDFALLETILWVPEDGFCLLDYHLERLAASAAYFSRSLEIGAIRGKLEAVAGGLPPFPHRIRLMVPRELEPTVEASVLKPLPQPYRVRMGRQPISPKNPFLYHKTTHRTVYEQALAEFPGCDDVLLWNEKNEVTESCVANLVVERDGRLLTPPVRCGLLPGTYRRHLLEQGEVEEEIIDIQDLPHCSRIYLVNSVRGKWEVSLDFGRLDSG